MNLKSSHSITTLHILLIAVAAVIPLGSIAQGAQFQQGDQIKLIRKEPLLFHDDIFRTGDEGEPFTVLAYRPEQRKIFFSQRTKTARTSLSP
jgi:hypothetical protein